MNNDTRHRPCQAHLSYGAPPGRAVEVPAQLGDLNVDIRPTIYDWITVVGPEIVGVRLTQAAYAHGLALALPEKVEMARPTVSEFTT